MKNNSPITETTSLYEFNDYREFLRSRLASKGAQRGERSRLAAYLNCQKAFVSQVLADRAHFSVEHAIKITQFLNLNTAETDFFMMLTHIARATNRELLEYYQKKIDAIRKQRREIAKRVKILGALSEADQSLYYSSWQYTAIHMCLMIPTLQTPRMIAGYLGIPLDHVVEILGFMTEKGLAIQSQDRYSAGPNRLHLPSNSPLVGRHHINYRIQAMSSLDHKQKSDLHYSLVMSISNDAAEEIRKILLNAIESTEPIIKNAKDEEVFVMNFDLFSLNRRILK